MNFRKNPFLAAAVSLGTAKVSAWTGGRESVSATGFPCTQKADARKNARKSEVVFCVFMRCFQGLDGQKNVSEIGQRYIIYWYCLLKWKINKKPPKTVVHFLDSFLPYTFR